MNLQYSGQAQKDLRKLPKNKVKVIVKKIELLQDNPYLGKKLGGKFAGFYSLRVWPYRVIYQINKWQQLIWIITVEHRQGVYK